jgi:hypothetical protein
MSENIDAEVENFLAQSSDESLDDVDLVGEAFASEGESAPAPRQAQGSKVVPSRRKQERRYINWRVALVDGSDAFGKIFYGKGYDLSLEGMSFRSECNINCRGEVRLILEVPLNGRHGGQVFIESRSKVIYSVLSNGEFQIGLKFNRFVGNGRALLEAELG